MLDKKLSSKRWQKQVINLGGVTDSYQPIEKKYALMQDVWRVLIKHKNPVVISTKSDLILRDFELIAELSNCTAVNIAATIITTDEMLKSKLEPNTASISQRFKMLKEFQKTKVSRGVHIMPLIPYITDSFSNLNSIFFMSKEIQIDYILTGLLNLRGKSRNVFLDFLQNEMPFYYQDIFNLFNNKDLKTSYLQSISLMLSDLYKYHDISDAFMAPLTKRMKELDEG
jgi:DNA repair photolyase